MNLIADKNDIIRFIPQRDPIVMVHHLVEASDSHAVTQLHLADDNIFGWEGSFTEPGLVENIAQTAAVHVGYQCSKKGLPIPIGYIAAIKDLKIFRLPSLGKTLQTTIRITNKVLDVTVVAGETRVGDEVLCRCEMRIFAKIQS